MKTRIFIFIIILAMLVACIGHLDSENDFMIRVGTGFKERTGKDYIQCWTTMKIGLEWKSPVSIKADMIV